MHESRLFKIVYYLLDKGQATAWELAEKFEVSVRTIYRDIDTLSQSGIPVWSKTGRNGGIYIMNDFVLDKVVLSDEEKQEILTSLQGISAIQSINNSDVLNKLSALFNINSEKWIEVDFSRWSGSQNDNEKFESLKSAVIHRKNVNITYAGSDETVSERVVEPLKLVYKSRAWYMQAYCTKKQDYRLFKLSRILDWEVLDDDCIHKPMPIEKDPQPQNYNQITLRFPKEMAYRVYDEFDKTWVRQQENGDLIVSAQMPEDAWLIGFLLSFGTQVEVIGPIYLRDILAEQARLIYEKNKI
ncbi:MAG: YafY family transcriptional regulator [Lachnospiraceae bacterium]|nr:YafY family transcriptional regulator [Lachnospiraceae bacterium]